jgi:hypothetical protein
LIDAIEELKKERHDTNILLKPLLGATDALVGFMRKVADAQPKEGSNLPEDFQLLIETFEYIRTEAPPSQV